ncbi:MAG: sporulation protein YtfJ [Ruminococcaceae bacterium]|nr:sporulation protein YtfJ [Oscillospiraceae bacterium]
MQNESKLQDLVRTSLESIRTLVDANTVIGDPIVTEQGVTIIPVSKISVGYASGGLDYAVKNEPQNSAKPKNFGGGGGTGLSVAPIGFIVISKTGTVDFINVGMKVPSDPIGQISDLLDRSPEIIGKIKEAFAKKPAENKEEATSEEAAE